MTLHHYRTEPLRVSVEGNGHKPGVESYRLQGVDLKTAEDERYWPWEFQHLRSLNAKYAGQTTPFGRWVADVVRQGPDMLTAACGNCAQPVDRCRCSFRAE